jgi:hypothetical protein
MVWSASLTASRRGGEGRLEAVAAAVVLGDDRIDGFPVQTTNLRALEEAPVQGREDGTREGRRGGLNSQDFGVPIRGNGELRRAICEAWRHLGYGRKRGKGEGTEGIL